MQICRAPLLLVVLNYIFEKSYGKGQPFISFIAIGDWGSPDDLLDQRAVAKAMGDWCLFHQCDFIISLGDNFYSYGVTSKGDPRFDSSWRNIYNQSSIANLPWYGTMNTVNHKNIMAWNNSLLCRFVSLGNHDHISTNLSKRVFVAFGQK